MTNMRVFTGLLFILLMFTLIMCAAINRKNRLPIHEQEEQCRAYLKEHAPSLEKQLQWIYELSFKDKDKMSLVEQISLEYDNEEVINYFKNITDHFKNYDVEKFEDRDLARQILLLVSRDERVLDSNERNEFKELIQQSKHVFENIKLCSYENPNDCSVPFDDVYNHLFFSNDEARFKWYWKGLIKLLSKDRLPQLNRFIELYRKIAIKNGFKKPTELIFAEYEDEHIFKKINELVGELIPLYQQFHAHVRHLLREKHGDVIPEKGPIPSYYLYRYMILAGIDDSKIDYPFPSYQIPPYDHALVAQNYTPQRFIEEADEFFKSMGLSSALTRDWKEFTKADEGSDAPSCQPKAKSYLARGALTFTYCSEINFQNFYNTHAQMLIVQQYNHARNLPLIYRNSFPPAFVSALEKTMKHAVSTPAHMKKIGVVDIDSTNPQLIINRLYLLAFKTLTDLLQSFSDVKYLFNLFDGVYNTTRSNCDYWKLQEKYVGLQPIEEVSNEDFDFASAGGSGLHDDDFENVVARFMAFNIYETLCRVSGKYEKGSKTKPLSNCDFSGNTDAGQLITKVLKTGASKPWKQIFSEITLKDDIDASSILEYFEPLRSYLESENKKNNIYVGWESSNRCH